MDVFMDLWFLYLFLQKSQKGPWMLLFVFMFLCLWYFCFQKKSKGLSVSLPYLSWNIETSAVLDILFLIVFMQLKLKIEQLVCHWRVKMLQAQSVFTGERLALLNFPPSSSFSDIMSYPVFWTTCSGGSHLRFKYWIYWLSVVTSSKCFHTFELLPPSLAFRHDVLPFYKLPSILNMFWRQPFEICSW